MKDYTVKVPIAGFVEVSIQALDKKAIIGSIQDINCCIAIYKVFYHC